MTTGHRVGTIFAEIGLDFEPYSRASKRLLQDATSTTTNIEKNFANLGIKSAKEFDLMRAKISNSYEMISKSGKASADDILRAEKAKNDQLKRLNEQQFGHQTTLLESVKKNWMAYSATVYAVIRALNKSRQEFRSFESALVDMGKVTDRSLILIKKDITDLSPALGDMTSLMKGYYQVISAGVTDPVKAIELLTTAAMASKAAHIDQSEVIKALTKMMAGYGGEIRTTSQAADVLFTTEKLGQTTVKELVPIIGDISKASKEAGLNHLEMAAALSLITQTAGDTSSAATQLRGILIGLLRPNEELNRIVENLGFTTGVAMVKQIGFAESLLRIRDQSDKTSVQIGKLFRSSEGMLGLASLSVDSFEKYKDVIVKMGEGAGSAAKAFDEFKKSAEAVDDELGTGFKNLMIEIGTSASGPWSAAVGVLRDTFLGLADAIRKSREESGAGGNLPSLEIRRGSLTPWVPEQIVFYPIDQKRVWQRQQKCIKKMPTL